MTAALEAINIGANIRGVLPSGIATVVSVKRFGSHALELTYKDAGGRVADELLYRDDEARLEIVHEGRPWSFDGDGALFRLVSEAQRIHLAHLFDPLPAVIPRWSSRFRSKSSRTISSNRRAPATGSWRPTS